MSAATQSPPPSPRCADARRHPGGRPPRMVIFSGRVAQVFAHTDDAAKRTRSGSHRALPVPELNPPPSPSPRSGRVDCVDSTPEARRLAGGRPSRIVGFSARVSQLSADPDDEAKRTRSGSHRTLPVHVPATREDDGGVCERPAEVVFASHVVVRSASSDQEAKRTRSGSDRRLRSC
jgi:hypothetical protein